MSRWDCFLKGMGCGANYGLTLGRSGQCSFFMWPSPLLLALAAVRLVYSARCAEICTTFRRRLARFDRCGI